ncbi:MAG: hypothetical protein ACK4TA_08150 [Saprospiraceae bacterium]
MKRILVQFPKTGLGNLMLVWARAVVFARLNGLEYVTSGWSSIRWGAWLRNERKKRLYLGYFHTEQWWERWQMKWILRFGNIKLEPPIQKLGDQLEKNCYYLFKDVIVDNNLFGAIQPYREWIKEELYRVLSPKLKQQLTQFKVPVIAAHIRRGDFKMGNPITPLSHFMSCIHIIRETVGKDLPVTIFSDADDHELQEILQLPEVRRAEEKADILDILLMSQSQFLLLSQSSTFSYWGAFLSEGIAILPEEDWQECIRNTENYLDLKISYRNQHSADTLRNILLRGT